MLRTPNLKPYIIYIKAPPFSRLKETRHQAFARSTFDETSSRSFTVRKRKFIYVFPIILYLILSSNKDRILLQ